MLNKVDDKINEIKSYWKYNGESSEIDDIVCLREMAYTDIYDLIQIIKHQQGELESWRKEGMI